MRDVPPVSKAPEVAPWVAGVLFFLASLSPLLAGLPYLGEYLWMTMLTLWKQT